MGTSNNHIMIAALAENRRVEAVSVQVLTNFLVFGES
jgi:hypothetical protein